MKVDVLLLAIYESINVIESHSEIKFVAKDLRKKLELIENCCSKNNLDDDSEIIQLLTVMNSDKQFREEIIYIVNFLYMGVLHSSGLNIKDCYKKTIGQFEHGIIRSVATKFLSNKYFKPLTAIEQSNITYLYNTLYLISQSS